tara:strand:- start:693 stop:848 length:156 start_codon:yes stop_codon:yes gene_type:complete
MGDWIFQAILSMLIATLGYIYFFKVFIIAPGTGVFNISDNIEYTIQEGMPP